MSISCVTCAEGDHLIYPMNEEDLTILVYLLHPQFLIHLNDLKQTNNIEIIKICLKCREHIRKIDEFRKSAMKNFLQLIDVWEKKPTIKQLRTSVDLKQTEYYLNPTVKIKDALTAVKVNSENINPTLLDSLTGDLILQDENIYSDDENEHKTDQSKTMLDNILQNMYVAKQKEMSPCKSQCKDLSDQDLVLKNESKCHAYLNVNRDCCSSGDTLNILPPNATEIQDEIVKIKNEFNAIFNDNLDEEEDLSTFESSQISVTPSIQRPMEKTVARVLVTKSQPTEYTGSILKQETETDVNSAEDEQLPSHNTLLSSCNDSELYLKNTETGHSCPICKKVFKKVRTMRCHRERTHGPKVYCTTCDKHYPKARYSQHLKLSLKHKIKKDYVGSSGDADTSTSTKVPCEICKKMIGVKSVKVHMERHNRTVYCRVCDKWYGEMGYGKHLATSLKHIAKDKYYRFSCDQCDTKLCSQAALRKHVDLVHLNILPYECPQCGVKFKEKSLLNKHVLVVHENKTVPKNYVCDVCGSAWETKAFLAGHMVVHTGARPYKCGVCDATFKHSSALYIHNKLKHEKKKQKVYKKTKRNDETFSCDQCDATLCSKSGLKRHVDLVHLNIFPYKCPQCGVKFKRRSSLNKHVLVVHENKTVPKNYVCDVCGSAWETKASLAGHMVVHTGARPYKCGVCDATFGHKAALYTHNKLKHEKKKRKVYKKTKRDPNKTSKEEGNT